MVSKLGLTYNRYLVKGDAPPPFSQNRPQAMETSPATSRARRAPTINPYILKELTDTMDDLVFRLNSKTPQFQSPVHFRVEHSTIPHISMVQENEVINRFNGQDVIELERSLYDMAGFQFSVEA